MGRDWTNTIIPIFDILLEIILDSNCSYITYKEISEDNRIHTNPLSMSYPLSILGRSVANITQIHNIPNIGCLVVNAKTLLPGTGIKEFWNGYENYNDQQKEGIVRTEIEYMRNGFPHFNWQYIREFLSIRGNLVNLNDYNMNESIDYYLNQNREDQYRYLLR